MSTDLIVVSGCEYANAGALLAEKNTNLLTTYAMYADAAPDVLKILSNHESSQVQQAVAQNPCTPTEVLDCLASNSWCEYLVAKNPNTAPQTLARLIMQPGTKYEACLNALSNPNTPFQVILRFLFSKANDSLVLAIEANPKYGDFNRMVTDFDERTLITRIENEQYSQKM